MKTYSADSGYVYQYYFAGQRAATREGKPGVQYVFQVSADRKTETALSVFVEDSVVEDWILRTGRELRGPHRYAIAKIALRNAFDVRRPEVAFAEVRPLPEEVAAILEELDV
jgi:hypothetical protein